MSQLKQIRLERRFTQRELADLMGVSDVTVSRWEAHESRLNVTLLRKLAVILRCSVADLVTEPTHVSRDYGSATQEIRLPFYGPGVSAGFGQLRSQPPGFRSVNMRRERLEGLGYSGIENLVISQVSGDSMMPKLQDRDFIILDLSPERPLTDGIFAITLDNISVVKRITVDPIRKKLTLSSDNPAYPATETVAVGEMTFAARVMWRAGRV